MRNGDRRNTCLIGDRKIRARLSSVRLSPERETEIVEEMSQHLEDRWRELVAGGASPDEASRLAREVFRGTDVLAQSLAPLRQARWTDPAPPAASRALSLEGLGADLRQALRGLRAAPSFTIGALLVLALGIGATTAIFSVVDAVVLRGLPFEGADRIVAVGERIEPRKDGKGGPEGRGKGRYPSACRARRPAIPRRWRKSSRRTTSIGPHNSRSSNRWRP